MRLRVASWNTMKNDGDYPSRVSLMSERLRAVEPDVVLLQESFLAGLPGRRLDTAAELAEALGFALVFAPARARERVVDGVPVESLSGHAVLSRHPIGASRRLQLRSTEAGGERIALIARIDAPAGPLHAACVHFSHVRGEDDVRRGQFTDVMAALAAFAAAGPALIGGDFNCGRGQAAIEEAVPPHGWRWRDLLLETGQGHPTHGRRGDGRGRRIDFILALERVGGPAVNLRGAGVAAEWIKDGSTPFLSDHAIVWADIGGINE